MKELDVLVDQLDELLAMGIDDAEDALEVATCAGLAFRLGATQEQLKDANLWREEMGRELLQEVWPLVDFTSLINAIDDCTDGQADDEDVEEAIFDFDDLVAAAHWLGHGKYIQAQVKQVSKIIRQIPDSFAPAAEFSREMVKLNAIGADLDLHDHLFALTTADQYA